MENEQEVQEENKIVEEQSQEESNNEENKEENNNKNEEDNEEEDEEDDEEEEEEEEGDDDENNNNNNNVVKKKRRKGKKGFKIDEDLKEHLNIVFIGHVDAGKSTIAGQILVSTGEVDQRTIDKYTREAKEKNRVSWFLAFIMDTNEEERAKGKTVEVGRANFETEAKRYTILDAPGHKNYVPNMIGGASQADVGVLVISARRGEFETGFDGGQTKEHATLIKTLGVQNVVVAINKMDESTVNWSQKRYDFIQKNVFKYLTKTLRFKKQNVYIVPVSGLTGYGINVPITEDVCEWYQGKTLLETLDTIPMMSRKLDAPLRIPVLDRYRDQGCTVAIGKIEAGVVNKGDTLVIYPNKQEAEVGFIEQDNGNIVTRARCGDQVNIGLKNINENDLSSGFVLCPLESSVSVVSVFVAKVLILETTESSPIITAGFLGVIHIHCVVEEIQIKKLVCVKEKKGKNWKKNPRFVKKNDLVSIIIEASKPICVELYSELPSMGNLNIRSEGKTIAVGTITKILK
eukprot:TRINITY_DN372_c2_g1_i1.p1 TRINITY_DN372_c2_g1~~TRINITY_DN372_c2_g1_i1.p1  ORF type:complete len:517 (-),score=245.41 TRINITY_DN372_c2_g1_i1:229-1779(-)